MDFIRPQYLAESLRVCTAIVDVLEKNRRYRNLSPFCEPQLGRRGLYERSHSNTLEEDINARLWVLNQSDGEHSLLDIAERSGLAFQTIDDAAEVLVKGGLLEPLP